VERTATTVGDASVLEVWTLKITLGLRLRRGPAMTDWLWGLARVWLVPMGGHSR
jgi:hypothetical protein